MKFIYMHVYHWLALGLMKSWIIWTILQLSPCIEYKAADLDMTKLYQVFWSAPQFMHTDKKYGRESISELYLLQCNLKKQCNSECLNWSKKWDASALYIRILEAQVISHVIMFTAIYWRKSIISTFYIGRYKIIAVYIL